MPPKRKVCVIVTAPDGRVLLLKRTPAHPRTGGQWQPVTGNLEGDEAPAVGAVREVEEETGLTDGDLQETGIVVRFAREARGASGSEGRDPAPQDETAFEEHVYAYRLPDARAPTLSDEHVEHAWLDPGDAAARVAYEGQREAIRAVAAANRP